MRHEESIEEAPATARSNVSPDDIPTLNRAKIVVADSASMPTERNPVVEVAEEVTTPMRDAVVEVTEPMRKAVTSPAATTMQTVTEKMAVRNAKSATSTLPLDAVYDVSKLREARERVRALCAAESAKKVPRVPSQRLVPYVLAACVLGVVVGLAGSGRFVSISHAHASPAQHAMLAP
jgi:hypothetical protein